jgi:hypothetical protein
MGDGVIESVDADCCRHVMSESVRTTDLAYAVEQFRQGLPASVVADRLTERGLPEHAIRGVLTGLLEGVEDDARQALQAGLLPQQVVRELRDWGLEPELAREVVQTARAKGPVGVPRPPAGDLRIVWFGAVLFTVGLLLMLFSVVFPGLDYFGGAAMGTGGLLWALGRPK